MGTGKTERRGIAEELPSVLVLTPTGTTRLPWIAPLAGLERTAKHVCSRWRLFC